MFEIRNNCNGLWNSLNFIKKREIKKELQKSNMKDKFKLVDHKTIINKMALRSLNDKEFKKRHPIISFFSQFLLKIRFFEILKFFPDKLPYMKLEFKKL